LGIGEPENFFDGVQHGVDTFDCVAPTRIARNGSLYTKRGKINLLNSKFVNDFSRVTEGCDCYTCMNYSKAYLAHLFRAREMLGATLASLHNLYFIISLVENIRKSILNEEFFEYKKEFLSVYNG
jgi:queuine tRNA-ribosyltransferase